MASYQSHASTQESTMLKQVARQILGKQRANDISYRRRLRAYGDTYLRARGWDRSIVSGQAEDQHGPIPWITYPALRMLERVVQPHLKVFEYGAGNSSLWWASRVAAIVSVEHNPLWARAIAHCAPPNLDVVAMPRHAPPNPQGREMAQAFIDRHPAPPASGDVDRDVSNGLVFDGFAGYAAEIARHGPGYFDIVVVDGMARSLTAWMAAHFVKDSGFIVFDNSDRWQYNAGYAALADAGFRRLDFFGTRPILVDESCTTIFARTLDWAAVNVKVPEGAPSDMKW